jgi:formamidopyrimidine-DNA glycosylase
MTEGPETYFYYTILKHLIGKKIVKLKILTKRYRNKDFLKLQRSLPLKIIDIDIKGKNIWFKFENGMIMYVTHGMSGSWSFKGDETRILNKYSIHRIVFEIDNEETLYFNDWNNIATIRIFYNDDELNEKLDDLGPCIFGKVSYKDFYERFEKKKDKEIAILLLDQSIIAGVGNYLRADILWKSRLSPYRKYSDLTENEKRRLYKYTNDIPMFHYKFMKKYGEVFPPERINTFMIYRKNKDKYGNKVKKDLLNGRSIYWVSTLQK